jgi:Leucine-rich repeat (LRR) protein
MQLPTNFGPLAAQLEALVLHDNHLSSLPEAIGSLTALRVLCLSSNRLTSLPDRCVSAACMWQVMQLLEMLGHEAALAAADKQSAWQILHHTTRL